MSEHEVRSRTLAMAMLRAANRLIGLFLLRNIDARVADLIALVGVDRSCPGVERLRGPGRFVSEP
jgi:hypothetical protein